MDQRVNRTALSSDELAEDNRRFANTAGISPNYRSAGFVPAYRDDASGRIAESTFADGRPAPIHVLDGLPAEWVMERDQRGRVVKVIATVVAGFVRDGQFYTRAEAHILASPRRR
jgi:hypothetical protein